MAATRRWFWVFLLLTATAAHAQQVPGTDLVARGRYLARAGDCTACHTAPNGAEFAGGLPLETPIGRIYSTNITPDRTDGIGDYTEEDFIRAVRDGVAKDGRHLYPAMPYPSYAKVSDADLHALYAYFQHGVTAVAQPNRPSEIPWILGFRWPLAFWDALFAGASPFQSDPAHDAQWNRGAYLVEGLGHCGACHTPRGLAFEEKASTDKDSTDFLAGADIDGWHAKSLRGGEANGLGRWSEHDIVTFLKTGRTSRSAPFANMAEVVQHSTQYLTDDDLAAIARYLKSLPQRPGELPASAVAETPAPAGSATHAAGPFDDAGAVVYGEFCTTCHRADGSGVPGIFPALAGNSVVVTDDATSLIRIVLVGGRMARTTAHPTAYAMPAFSRLDDAEVARVVTYARTAWGNNATAVTADQVATARAALPAVEAHR